MKIFYSILLVLTTELLEINLLIVDECSRIHDFDVIILNNLSKVVIPELDGKIKGEAGKVAIIGGSIEYTGAPYFAAISALKVGADLVYVFTTENAAPVIKSYSPDLIVIPHNAINITSLLHSIHVVVIGPGLGRSTEGLNLAYETIRICKQFRKPLVIDADGLYAIYQNPVILKDYPSPGAILTPNNAEVRRLKQAVTESDIPWYKYWGDFVTVLQKGETDMYFSNNGDYDWSLHEGGSGRRTGGQGDILSGALGTLFNWGLKANLCENTKSAQLAQSVAAYAAAKFTRVCNSNAYKNHGRSMLASDMLNEIHKAFDELFL
ncbi:ATP-dependent (S)-NAD(P)H-hydrate dehydratase-like [Pararge aegeria]|uniref:ATP-dependent (S)-NAD(P)H-hydrate dehydratase n=2 Tax=Pararge aegeria TaxID=116150 RepID=A0A8S4R586_9NEOP|nr:ATP-dependent (S)-NAD(P)H-hydrate dehydratase-like [Pararge aegeria]CAH2230082.1 jg22373 [Pararge aegeria aegeria]